MTPSPAAWTRLSRIANWSKIFSTDSTVAMHGRKAAGDFVDSGWFAACPGQSTHCTRRGLRPQRNHPNQITVAASCGEGSAKSGRTGVVVFRPKGPAVQIAWPSGPGKSPPNHRPGPKGRQFISSACRMAGPLSLKIFFLLVDQALRARLLEPMALWAARRHNFDSTGCPHANSSL